MSIQLYDEAITKKISNWIKDPNLKILKPEESTRFFELKLDENKDTPLKLPLISISREKDIEILSITKQPKTFSGFIIEKTFENNITLNAIPVRLGYQIDIYTKGMFEATEYVRNFVFNLINYPKLEILIPYNGINMIHRSNINLESSIVDNTDIKEHLFSDQFTRFTLKITIDDAYLFSAPLNENGKIEGIDLEVQNRITKEIEETTKIL